MRTKLGFGLGVVGALLFTTATQALDVCDALGLSGLTISTDGGLEIKGGVEYEFKWGDRGGTARDEGDAANERMLADIDWGADPTQDCGRVWKVGDLLAFSNFRVNLDPGFIFSAPDPVGFLEAGTPVAIPAYTVPVSYSGFKLGAGIETRLNFNNFVPMDLALGVEVGQINGKGTGGSQAFGNLGVPSVGLVNGVLLGGATVNSTDFTTSRTFANFDKQLHVPIFGGQHETMGYNSAYVGYVIAGTRFGGVNETQTTRIATSSGTVNYDTSLTGGFAGGYLGLGMDKTMTMPNSDIVLGGNLGIAAGFDMHRYRVTESISGTAGMAASTNTFDVSDWVPTLKLGGGVSILRNGWSFGLNGSVSAGYYPTFHIINPISNQPATPTFDARSPVTGEVSADLRFRY